jgi:CubicO group peptidase (beta-lactamase class C family)
MALTRIQHKLRSFTHCLFFGLALAVLWPMQGQVPHVAASGEFAAAPTDPEDLEAFFDAFVTEGLSSHTLPGVSLAVVAGGETIFLKGYGYADIDQTLPVDPERTLFDVGSVAKLFTYTAVMQLVEEGRLDLHADINRYLTRFQVPATFPEPVTAAHLLTHTGGFDEWDIGAAVRTPEEVLPVCEYLAQRLPPRVRPSGELIGYSNHGTALAGCLVEEISGVPFATYIDTHIFAPLGMARSTFVWPPELMADMAVGYRRENDTLQPMGIYYRHFGPAGELKTTAMDMTRFMLAHLQEGAAGNGRILEPETARHMHSQQFTHHPLLPGITYGFFEERFNGHRALVHGGDTNPIFASLLVLLPEENVGLFIAHNTAEYAFREALVRAFMDRYFPRTDEVAPPEPLPEYAERAGRFTGLYAPTFLTRETSLEKLLTLFAQFRITTDASGLLTLNEPAQLPGDTPLRWIEVEPGIFQSIEGDDRMVFFEDDAGHITHMATSRYPAAAFLPRTWVDGPVLHLELLVASIALFLSAIVTWIVRRRRGALAWHDHLLPLASALNLLFILGLAVMLQSLAFDAIFGLPLWARGLLLLPVLSSMVTAVAVVVAGWAWRNSSGSLATRVHNALVLVGAVAFIWQVLYWNLTVFH